MLVVIMTASISEIKNASVSSVNLCFEFNLFFSFSLSLAKISNAGFVRNPAPSACAA